MPVMPPQASAPVSRLDIDYNFAARMPSQQVPEGFLHLCKVEAIFLVNNHFQLASLDKLIQNIQFRSGAPWLRILMVTTSCKLHECMCLSGHYLVSPRGQVKKIERTLYISSYGHELATRRQSPCCSTIPNSL